MQGIAKHRTLYVALQKLGKDHLYEWFNLQLWIPHSDISKEFLKNKRQGKLINLICAEIATENYDNVLRSLYDLDQLRKRREEANQVRELELIALEIEAHRLQVPIWLQHAKDAKDLMNSIQVGQVIWLIDEDKHFYFEYPAIVCAGASASVIMATSYISPSFESHARHLKDAGGLPPELSIDSKAHLINQRQYSLVPLASVAELENRLCPLALTRWRAWRAFDEEALGIRLVYMEYNNPVFHRRCTLFKQLEKRICLPRNFYFQSRAKSNGKVSDFGKWMILEGTSCYYESQEIRIRIGDKICYSSGTCQTAMNEIFTAGINVTSICQMVIEYAEIRRFKDDWQIKYREKEA
jgi:hypothetical protein